MVKLVLDNVINGDFTYNSGKEKDLFDEAVKNCLEADTPEARIVYMLHAQFRRVATMTLIAYNGYDEETTMPYNAAPRMDVLTGLVRDDLGNAYNTVIQHAESIVALNPIEVAIVEVGEMIVEVTKVNTEAGD